MTFNPEKHLMELQGKSYLEVKWRLVWFRQECPNGTIDTEEMLVDLDREVEAEVPTGNWIANPNRPGKKMPEKIVKSDKGYARFRAIVTDGKGGRATATKAENAAAFPDYIEKAETGAVGRALAMLGYGTQFTGEDLNEEHRIVDAPTERSQTGVGASSGNGRANTARATTDAPTPATDAQDTPADGPTPEQLAEIARLNELTGKNMGIPTSKAQAEGTIKYLLNAAESTMSKGGGKAAQNPAVANPDARILKPTEVADIKADYAAAMGLQPGEKLDKAWTFFIMKTYQNAVTAENMTVASGEGLRKLILEMRRDGAKQAS